MTEKLITDLSKAEATLKFINITMYLNRNCGNTQGRPYTRTKPHQSELISLQFLVWAKTQCSRPRSQTVGILMIEPLYAQAVLWSETHFCLKGRDYLSSFKMIPVSIVTILAVFSLDVLTLGRCTWWYTFPVLPVIR